jgi:hypothetical protein
MLEFVGWLLLPGNGWDGIRPAAEADLGIIRGPFPLNDDEEPPAVDDLSPDTLVVRIAGDWADRKRTGAGLPVRITNKEINKSRTRFSVKTSRSC